MNDAASLYGSIIYRKAPVVMKMLERLTGEEEFQEGMREYLATFGYANAAWPDLIGILDRRLRYDLASWSDVWVEKPRRPTIYTSLERDTEGNIARLSLDQSDPADAGRLWDQRLNVVLSYPHTTRSFPVQLDAEGGDVDAAIGLPAPDFVLANGAGLGYGLFVPDSTSLEYLLQNLPAVEDGPARGVAWLTLWDAMLESRIPPGRIIDLALATLATERDELIIERVLSDLEAVYWRYLPRSDRDRRAPDIESFLWSLTEGAKLPRLKSAYFETYRSLALTGSALHNLTLLWRGELEVEGLSLSERDHTSIALLLAVHEVPDADRILDEQMDRIDNPDRSDQFVFVRSATSADPRVRDDFFDRLADETNREHEPWVLEGLGYLHHPLRAGSSERYIAPSLGLLEEIKQTGDIFFPKRWLDATLSGHSSAAVAQTVCDFLVQNPGYPRRLRQKIQQSADPLFRAASILHGFDASDCE
jgi:aminopeptidase N